MPSLQQLRYLVAVADTLHFSEAAERMSVTQPTLSMQIKELEGKLGATLLERTRARVILTPLGAEVTRRARAVLGEVDDIRQLAKLGPDDSLQGQMQLGVVDTVGAYLLAVVMPALRARHRGLRLTVREGRPNELLNALAAGRQDLLALPDLSLAQGDGFGSEVILREPWHVVFPADHPLGGKEMLAPEDLSGQTLLMVKRGPALDEQVTALCRDTGAILSRDFEGTSLDTVRQMVAAGMGIALLPALYIRSEVLRESAVEWRPLRAGAPLRELLLIWRRTSPRADAYRQLAVEMRAALAPYEA